MLEGGIESVWSSTATEIDSNMSSHLCIAWLGRTTIVVKAVFLIVMPGPITKHSLYLPSAI